MEQRAASACLVGRQDLPGGGGGEGLEYDRARPPLRADLSSLPAPPPAPAGSATTRRQQAASLPRVLAARGREGWEDVRGRRPDRCSRRNKEVAAQRSAPHAVSREQQRRDETTCSSSSVCGTTTQVLSTCTLLVVLLCSNDLRSLSGIASSTVTCPCCPTALESWRTTWGQGTPDGHEEQTKSHENLTDYQCMIALREERRQDKRQVWERFPVPPHRTATRAVFYIILYVHVGSCLLDPLQAPVATEARLSSACQQSQQQ
eukprot:768706-Hanusia_phi.AAC.7